MATERLVEDILGAMSVALKAGDMEGVIALWKMLAIQDPDKAAALLSIVQAAP